MPRGRKKLVQNVRVETRPEAPDGNWIPTEITELFLGRGQRLSLACIIQASKLARHQRYPMQTNDIPETVRDGSLQILKRAGFSERDGQWRRGDTVLCLQSLQLYNEMGKNARVKAARNFISPEAESDQLRDQVQGDLQRFVRVEPNMKQNAGSDAEFIDGVSEIERQLGY